VSYINESGLAQITTKLKSYVDSKASGGGVDYGKQMIERTISSIEDSTISKIGSYAFYGYSAPYGLSISFPKCYAIYPSAFVNCSNRLEVNASSAMYIGSYAFSSCGLVSAIFPLCNYLNSGTFNNNNGYLLTADFKGVEGVANNVFYSCKRLKDCIIGCPDNLSGTFYSAESLASLYLLTMVPATLSTNVFYRTPMSISTVIGHFGSIYVPSNAVSIYKASTNWSTYTDRITNLPAEFDSKYVYGYEYSGSTLTEIPSEKSNVEYVIKSGFYDCSNLSSVNLSKCEYVGTGAFANCTSLTQVNLPNCKRLVSTVFSGCTNLSDISIPKCLSIGNSAFNGCTSLTTISLPECVNIAYSAFSGCTNLSSISIPECTFIGGSAFTNCTSLSEIYLPKCLDLGAKVFDNCNNLTFIDLPELKILSTTAFSGLSASFSISLPKCEQIRASAFYDCTNLSTISLPECSYIYAYTFYKCYNLSTISIPKCRGINASTFHFCSSLLSIDAPEASVVGLYAFHSCTSLTSVNLPKCSVIGASAFCYTNNLESINVPLCKIIESTAFYMGGKKVSVLSVPICSSIYSRCFELMTSLHTLIIGTDLSFVCSAIGIEIFHYTPMQYSSYLGYYGSVYVPDSLVEDYKIATNWVSIADRITGISNLPSV